MCVFVVVEEVVGSGCVFVVFIYGEYGIVVEWGC